MILSDSHSLAGQPSSYYFKLARNQILSIAMIGRQLLWYGMLLYHYIVFTFLTLRMHFLWKFQCYSKAPLYWDIYAPKGLNSARICFTCHNFEYQGAASASDLASCGLDVNRLNRPDRMQHHSGPDRVNPVKVVDYFLLSVMIGSLVIWNYPFSLKCYCWFQGAIVFSNIVTTVSPTYAQEVRTSEVWVSATYRWACKCKLYLGLVKLQLLLVLIIILVFSVTYCGFYPCPKTSKWFSFHHFLSISLFLVAYLTT